MNTKTLHMFRCLKLDLRVQLKSEDESSLNELKNALLKAVQIPDAWDRMSRMNEVLGYQAFDYFVYCLSPGHESAVFRDIYQVLTFVLKVKVEPSEQQIEEYVEKLLERESETRQWRPPQKVGFQEEGSDTFSLFRAIVCVSRAASASSLDLSRDRCESYCQVGPGATFDRSKGDDKKAFVASWQSLAAAYGEDFHNGSLMLHADGVLESVDNGASEMESRLTLVPKDNRGPRGVFIQPHEALFVQLGQKGCFDAAFSATNGWFLTMHDPKSQTPNQIGAELGSSGWGLATLDLSDASDRVPLKLIRYLFHRGDYLRLARTRTSRLSYRLNRKSGSVRLAMFAPMGAGTCFPVLTWVVCSVCLGACMHQDGFTPDEIMHMPSRRVQTLARKYNLRIFGDDIEVAIPYYATVVRALEICNLKVNVSKSFASGPFRESCGTDSHRGMNVTPYRLKRALHSDPTADDLQSLIGLHNRMVYGDERRLRLTVDFLRRYIESKTRVTYSLDWECPNGLWVTNDRRYRIAMQHRNVLRFNVQLQRWEVKTWTTRKKKFAEPLCSRWNYNYRLFELNRTQGTAYAVFSEREALGSYQWHQAMHEMCPRLWSKPKDVLTRVNTWVDLRFAEVDGL